MASHISVSETRLLKLQAATKADTKMATLVNLIQIGWPRRQMPSSSKYAGLLPIRRRTVSTKWSYFYRRGFVVPEHMQT